MNGPRRAAPDTFRLPPRVASALRDEIVEQALAHHRPQGQRSGRRRVGHRALHRRRPDPGPASRRVRRRSRQADHQVDGAAPADPGRSGTVRQPRRGAPRLQQCAARGPGDPAGQRRTGASPGSRARLRGPARAGAHGHRPAQRAAAVDEFNRPAVGFTLKPDAARRFGGITERNINRLLATVLDNRVMSVATIQIAHRRSGTDRRRQPGGDDRAGHQPELGRAARGPGVCRGAHRRREPRRRVDSRRRAGVAGRPRPRAAVHARLLPAGRRQRARLGPVEPARAAGDHGLPPGDAHAPGHRRPDSDDRHGRRLERADLRADQGGARHRRRPASGGQGRLHARLADDRRHARHVADRRGLPLSVRHHADSRLCHHAGDRPAGERLHRGVRVAHAVRASRWDADRRLDPLRIGRSQLFAGTRANFTRWRWHALVLSLVIVGAGLATVATRGLPAGHRLLRRHAGGRGVRAGRGDRGAGAGGGFGIAGRRDRAALRRRGRTPVPDSPAARLVGQRRPGGHGPADRAGVARQRACRSSRSRSAIS